MKMHILLHYIKVSDNTMLIFICSDGAVSFFFHYQEHPVAIFRQGVEGWGRVGRFVHFCMVSQEMLGK